MKWMAQFQAQLRAAARMRRSFFLVLTSRRSMLLCEALSISQAGAGCVDAMEGVLAILGIESYERLWRTLDRAKYIRDIIGASRVGGERGEGRKAFEVLRKALAAAATMVTVLHRMEESFAEDMS